jgi:hypothetical protein
MMFFTIPKHNYVLRSPVLKAFSERTRQYESMLIKDECSLDALQVELESKIHEVNAEYPTQKNILLEHDHRDRAFSAYIPGCTCYDAPVSLHYCKVNEGYPGGDLLRSSIFIYSTCDLSPYNNTWKKLIEWLRQYIGSIIFLDDFQRNIEAKLNEINAEHPQARNIQLRHVSRGAYDEAIIGYGHPYDYFEITYFKVNGIYQFSENNDTHYILKGGRP